MLPGIITSCCIVCVTKIIIGFANKGKIYVLGKKYLMKMKVRIVSILRKYPDLTLLYLSQFWGAEKRIILEVVHKICVTKR